LSSSSSWHKHRRCCYHCLQSSCCYAHVWLGQWKRGAPSSSSSWRPSWCSASQKILGEVDLCDALSCHRCSNRRHYHEMVCPIVLLFKRDFVPSITIVW
jgi:hypothetical protein